jgi:hypothetical protein
MDVEFFLSRAEREFDPTLNRIVLNARDKVHADALKRCCVDVAVWGKGREIVIHWRDDEGNPYRIPPQLASYAKSPPKWAIAGFSQPLASQASHPEAPNPNQTEVIATPTQHITASVKPRSKDDELIIWAQLNEKPTGICSLTNGKVLFMNSLMPEFCGLAYDQIAVPDIATQFAKRDERDPTDLVEFNERLIKDKVINGSMKAFRTSGAFGNFHGRYTFTFLNGVPVRISEYDTFEVID